MNNDLISRSALLEILRHCNDEPGDVESDEYFEWDNMCAPELLEKILDVVETFSPVDAEPVQHGEWIYDPNANDFGIGGYVCSVCSAKNNNLPCNAVINPQIFVGSRFCPDCGAKMDGGKNNGTAK